MTYEEIEKTLQRAADIHVVEAERLDRLDQKMDELGRKVRGPAGVSHSHCEALDRLIRASEAQNQQLTKLAEMIHARKQLRVGVEGRLAGVEEETALFRSTVDSVLKRMDAFIEGLLKGHGHSKKWK